MSLPGGQRVDPATGSMMPWFTHGALDEIQTWDLQGKRVLEWGAGFSTLWWRSRGAIVFALESDWEWVERLRGFCGVDPGVNVSYCAFENAPRGPFPLGIDIAVIDGFDRLECLRAALVLPRPLTLIFDNWQQDDVFVSDEAAVLMSSFDGRFYVQPDHVAHSGRPWQTAIWRLE